MHFANNLVSCGQDTSRCLSCSCAECVMAVGIRNIFGIILPCCCSDIHLKVLCKTNHKNNRRLCFSWWIQSPPSFWKKTFDFVCPQRTLSRKLYKLCHEIKASRRKGCFNFLVVYIAPVEGSQTSFFRCCPSAELKDVRTVVNSHEYLHRAPLLPYEQLHDFYTLLGWL